jgi:RimJ/RimL family protein N-acetyltransferase
LQPPLFPSIETERPLLREIVQSDSAALRAVHGDPESMKWFGVDPIADQAAASKQPSRSTEKHSHLCPYRGLARLEAGLPGLVKS